MRVNSVVACNNTPPTQPQGPTNPAIKHVPAGADTVNFTNNMRVAKTGINTVLAGLVALFAATTAFAQTPAELAEYMNKRNQAVGDATVAAADLQEARVNGQAKISDAQKAADEAATKLQNSQKAADEAAERVRLIKEAIRLKQEQQKNGVEKERGRVYTFDI